MSTILLAAASSGVLAGPEQAITYVERQLRNDAPTDGRSLATNGSAFYGIDINSSLEVAVDVERLTAQIVPHLGDAAPDEQTAALSGRLEMLTAAVEQIDPTIRSLTGVFETWARAEGGEDFAPFRVQIQTVNSQIFRLLDTIRGVIERERVAAGVEPQAALEQSRRALDAVLGSGGMLGYDWDALRNLYTDAIRGVEADLAALGDGAGLAIEIQAHLLAPGAPQGVPIYLPGYNQVAVGPGAVYQKVRYDVPPEALAARDMYLDMAESVEETRDLGQALRASLEAQYRRHEQEIRRLLASTEAAAAAFETAFEGGDWGSRDARREWFESLPAEVAQGEAGRNLTTAWNAAQDAVDSIASDLEALQSYAQLNASLAGAVTPEAALTTIQAALRNLTLGPEGEILVLRVLDGDAWMLRVQALSRLLESVRALGPDAREALLAEDGPMADFAALRDAGEDLRGAVTEFSTEARRALFGSLAFPASDLAASLPIPVGQTKLGLAPNADVGTSLDLKTIASGREPGNEVRISYRFFRGEDVLPLGWTDRFLIGVYGWQDHVAAGLALVQQESADTWEPTANLSWLLKKRRWPVAAEPGLAGLGAPEWYSGFGLSTMPLQFEDDQDIEIGMALTAAFLNDRIIIGYGVNLQAVENDTFSFISLRLFQNDGILKGAPGR